MKFLFPTVAIVLLLSQSTTATWGKYGGGGGGCGGGCGSPCSGGYGCGESAPLLETSGCAGGACVDSSSHSSSSSSGGGYHTKKTTTIVKEEKNDEFSLVIGGGGHGHSGRTSHKYVQPEVTHHQSYVEQPVEVIRKKTTITQSAPQIRTWVEPVGTIVRKKTTYIDSAPVHQTHHRSHHESYVEEPSVDTVVTKRKTTYVSQPVSEISGYTRETYVQPVQPVITRKTTVVTAPVVHKTTIYKEPIVVHKHRYVDSQSSNYENDCTGPCGGSKIVKVIKKTYTEGDSCPSCGGGGGYTSGRYESSYSEPETVVHKKVTRVISSGPSYSSSSDCYGGDCGRSSRYSSGSSGCPGGECGGYGGSGKSGSFAFASASASAKAGGGSYSGGGRGGCKTGCDEWKK